MAKKGMVANTTLKQSVRVIIHNALTSYFKDTLNKENDIENLVMALVQTESSFNYEAKGPSIPLVKSSGARDYFNSTAVSAVYKKGNAQQMSNIEEGLRAWGLMQVMGWNVVKGGSTAGGGKTEIERARPDLASQLIISPGESISAKYSGEANVLNQILAGLVILESKWKAAKKVDGGWQIGSVIYADRMSCAFRGYIGLGAVDNGNGGSPISYVSTIVNGPNYKAANGPGAVYVANKSAEKAAAGPPITVASGSKATLPGCVKSA
ncbi:hypothetical protein D3C87_279980 [compost metagenome]